MTQSKKDLQQAIIDGAIEAAEIISQRAVRDESDRLQDQISEAEQTQKERVDAALQAVKSLVAVLQETQAGASAALQQDLLRMVEVLRVDAERAARDATEDGIAALEAKLQAAVSEMSKRTIDYVDERHDVAVRSMSDKDAIRYDELRQKLNDDAEALLDLQETKAAELTRSVAEVLEQQKTGVKEILEQALSSMDESEKKLVQIITERYTETEKSVSEIVADLRAEHDELSEKARDLLDTALLSVGDAISEAIEDSQKKADALRTELFLATEEFQHRTQDEIQKALDNLEVPDPVPGPPGEQGEPGPQGEKGDPGALTRVDVWHEDREYTRRACVSHKGGIWQARSDTEEEPGHSVHWSSIVESIHGARRVDGRIILLRSDGEETDLGDFQGPPGRDWKHVGTYKEGKKDYEWGNVVILRGTSYVARCDAPGTCPGKDWRMVAQAKQGPAGKPGRTGKQGMPGPPGPVGPPGQSIGPWRGKWTSTEAYDRNEIVNFAHALWIALQDVPPGQMPKADQIYWDLFLRANVGGGGGSGGGGIGTDELVGVTGNDASPGHLLDKVQSGDGSVIFSVVNAGGDETLDFQATGAGGGESNVGNNVGGGAALYRDKSGVILNYRTIGDTARVTASVNGDVVEMTVPDGVFADEAPNDGLTKLRKTQAGVSAWVDAGDSAIRDVGNTAGDVAAGDAPDAAAAAAVSSHDANQGAHNGNLPSSDQKAALNANPALNAGNRVADISDIVDEGADLKSSGEGVQRILVTDGVGGFVYEPKPATGGGGAGFERNYQYDSNTNPGPASGTLRMDSATMTSVTTVWCHEDDQNGFNLGAIASNMDPDDVITLSDTEGVLRSFKLTGTPSLAANVWTFPVTHDGGTLNPVNGTNYFTLFAAGEADAPVSSVSGNHSVVASPTTGDVVVQLANDETSPGANQVYGTDGAGTKGWKPDPAAGTTLHADLTDTDTDGHPGSVINIPGGVQGNAVSIAADGTLVDSGVPPGGAGGTTDLSNTPSATEVTVESSSGQNTSLARATGSLAGVMAAADKTDLDAATTHVASQANPHNVTAAQAGADPAGTAAAAVAAHEGSFDHGNLPTADQKAAMDAANAPAAGNAFATMADVSPGGGIEDGYTENIAADPATSGTITIPGTISRVFDIALTGNATLALGTAPGATEATIQTIRFTHSGGPHTLALPAGVQWVDGAEVAIGGAGTSTVYKISRFGTATAILEGAVASTP